MTADAPETVTDLDREPEPPDLRPILSEIVRQLRSLDVPALSALDALDLLAVLFRVAGREVNR